MRGVRFDLDKIGSDAVFFRSKTHPLWFKRTERTRLPEQMRTRHAENADTVGQIINMMIGILSRERVEQRVEAAKQDAISLFIDPKSSLDFYFEDILNCFIALTQYPLNFAIFSGESCDIALKFHLCSDKEHEAKFEEIVTRDCGEAGQFVEQKCFKIFPDVLEVPYYIAVYHMRTKVHGGMRIVTPMQSMLEVSSIESYISLCANLFFECEWDVFSCEFASDARSYIENSLLSLSNNHTRWLDKQGAVLEALDEISYPNDSRDDWKVKLEEVFDPTLYDNISRVNIARNLLSERSDATKKSQLITPPNMILAIRAYSREISRRHDGKVVGLRHEVSEGVGYTYDTVFLLPDSIVKNISGWLSELKRVYLDFKDQLALGRSKDIGTFFLHKGMRLYRDIDLGDDCDVSRQFLESLDNDFLEGLAADDGVERSIACLQSWVGDYSRSLVDPVYHTSLVHTNMLFEYAGLDRVAKLVQSGRQSILEVEEHSRNDVRRVVVLYYLMGSMVSWSGYERPDFSRCLAAVLVPICMRGSVWGVAIHATRVEDYDLKFADERYWQAYFKIVTDLRRKQTLDFDKCLWGQALYRLEQMLERNIAEAFDKEGLGDAVVAGILKTNLKMQQETRVSPFAFPKLHTENHADVHASRRCTYSPSGEEAFDISWEVLDNRFFHARQGWSLRGTRNFKAAMEMGHRRGFTVLTYKVRLHRKETEYLKQLLLGGQEQNGRPS